MLRRSAPAVAIIRRNACRDHASGSSGSPCPSCPSCPICIVGDCLRGANHGNAIFQHIVIQRLVKGCRDGWIKIRQQAHDRRSANPWGD